MKICIPNEADVRISTEDRRFFVSSSIAILVVSIAIALATHLSAWKNSNRIEGAIEVAEWDFASKTLKIQGWAAALREDSPLQSYSLFVDQIEMPISANLVIDTPHLANLSDNKSLARAGFVITAIQILNKPREVTLQVRTARKIKKDLTYVFGQ